MKAKIYLLCISLFATNLVSGQGFQFRVLKNTRSDWGLSYNFFHGDNVDDFRTSIKGFGSGFLLDAFTGRYSKDIIYLGTNDVHLTLGAGVALSKYKFSEPLIFEEADGDFGYRIDDDPTHEYGNGFFSNDKSKLVVGTFTFPAYLNFDIGSMYISAGGMLDLFLSGKHKLKYTVDGKRQTEVIKNEDFNDFPINKTKWGVGGMIMHKPSGVNVGITYMLTPFFKDNSAFPEMNEVRISFSYDLSWLDH